MSTSPLESSVRALVLLAVLSPTPLLAADWVTFTDETATRLVAAPSVGVDDPEEKDFSIGDLDQDGDVDLVVGRKTPFTSSGHGPRRNVLFMNENGVLTDRTATLAVAMLDATDDREVLVVDLDGDGWLDVVTGTTFGDQPRAYMNLGDDEGGAWQGLDFQLDRLPSFSPNPKFCGLAAGDVNGDDAPDLYFTDYDNSLEDRLLINDGNGFFTDQTTSRMTPAMATSTFALDAAIEDMNGDGFRDILKVNATGSFPPPGFSPKVSILYNNGSGNFTAIDPIHEVNQGQGIAGGYMADVRDFNQDGLLDVFVVDDLQDRLLVNAGNDVNGIAQFTGIPVANSPDTTGFGGNAVSADLDLDGVLDMLVADVDTDLSGCNRQFALLRGRGTPPNVSYWDPIQGADRPWKIRGVFDVAVFDVNNDGAPDLVIGHCDGTSIFMGDPELGVMLFRDDFENGNTARWSATGGPRI